MISDRDAGRLRPVLVAIRNLSAGRKRLQDLTLSTTEKLALCLACELPLPTFCKSEKDELGEIERCPTADGGHHQPEISGAGVD